MNNDLCVFNNDMFGELNIIMINDKPYFEGVGVASMLGYSNSRAAVNRHCKHPGVTFRDVGVVTGKKRNGTDVIQYVPKTFIDEGNLYRLIIKSKKKEAEFFERWVMDEVLPSIRKNGGYAYSEKVINNLVNICTAQYESIEKLVDDKRNNMTYISLGKSIAESSDAISIGGFSKILHGLGIDIGRNRLFDWFRANGYIMKQCGENHPKQVYIDKGLFTTRQYGVNTDDGVKIMITIYITGKGQAYFIDKIIKGCSYDGYYKEI